MMQESGRSYELIKERLGAQILEERDGTERLVPEDIHESGHPRYRLNSWSGGCLYERDSHRRGFR